ncbi:TFIIB-type zinc ribbon-containing protein [Natronomonas salsuginis]|uniref:TFIIB-type domain-containing protein n=1 Tax=Natronomonas salsuginis TaxID=2217661 RepID=A0A4U5JA01_9EURY|nr:TFIIB-type zinc ribbon-containing protein [Natronomonas salsuginis]TKR25071.1 hypothetical protein DM868_11980 [Natronomonas salsuginis]
MTQQKYSREQPPDGREDNIESIEEIACSECSDRIIQDSDQDETTCENCGLIFEEGHVDHGPEWRAFMSEHDEKEPNLYPDYAADVR